MNSPEAGADCAFCAIAAGLLPSSRVYSDDEVLAFLDVEPVNTGHLLVVPRVHAASLADLHERIGARLFITAQRLAAALRASGLPCDGVNMYLADGAAAGQEVDHVHLHVVPRQAGDGFELRARFQRPDRSELDAAAATIRMAQSVRGGVSAPDS